jgi:hypothetical protein
MSPDTPDGFIALLGQPSISHGQNFVFLSFVFFLCSCCSCRVGQNSLVTEELRVEIVHLKGTVVHVGLDVGAQEEGMVVDKVFTAVNVGEERHVPLLAPLLLDEEPVGGHEVEVPRIELPLRFEVGDAEAEMAELAKGIWVRWYTLWVQECCLRHGPRCRCISMVLWIETHLVYCCRTFFESLELSDSLLRCLCVVDQLLG